VVSQLLAWIGGGGSALCECLHVCISTYERGGQV
jgi:hypothetical protein